MPQHDEMVMRPIWLALWKYAQATNTEIVAVNIMAHSNRATGDRARDLHRLLLESTQALSIGMNSEVDRLHPLIIQARAKLLETLESDDPEVGREVERKKGAEGKGKQTA